jgi:hypothetical protein
MHIVTVTFNIAVTTYTMTTTATITTTAAYTTTITTATTASLRQYYGFHNLWYVDIHGAGQRQRQSRVQCVEYAGSVAKRHG